MKKLILAIAAFAAMSISASAAEVTGSILSTDIGTLIDGAPCKTYNVDGRTFVIAEDLRGYGFDVVYDDSIRRLTITQNPYSERTILSKEEINIEKSSITVGQWLGDMFATDITVYLGDEQIEGYAIDGKMVIPVRALESCAYVEFDENRKVVAVSGLKHYLTARHKAGNTNVLYEHNENDVELYSKGYDVGGHNLIHESSMPATTNSTVAYDTENGTISAHWGNLYRQFHPSGRYHFSYLYNFEDYTITNSDGVLLYDIQISGANTNTRDLSIENGYLRNNTHAVRFIMGYTYLFSTCIAEEKDYYCYWPNTENPIFSSFSTNGGLLSENGYLYEILKNNTISSVKRHNIKDSFDNYYLSLDNKLYKENKELAFEYEINSIFDKLIDDNVLKYSSGAILKTDNTLYIDNAPLIEDVKDFIIESYASVPYITVLTTDNKLYIGTKQEYAKNRAGLASTDVKSIHSKYGSTIYFINNNNELYSYSISEWSTTKLADNIRKIVNNKLFITTNDELTDLTGVIATNVKDATEKYILTNDNTIIDRTTGEQIFPKP